LPVLRYAGAAMIVMESEIAALVERLMARANSILFRDQPDQQPDLRLAARILARVLVDGTVHGFVRLDDEMKP
jgi:hypothetical protein